MVKQNNIAPAPGSRHTAKRVGRGDGSGHGTYSGRGCKGQKARAGNNKVRPGFEGGQLPLIKRLPRKRGFTNIFRVEYTPVTTGELNKFDSGSEVTPEILKAAGIIKSINSPVKILAGGKIDHPLTVKANKFSASAKAMIETAGGKVEEVEHAAKAE
ncbi:MAG: 50S ribosomal protein L15 [Chloroflexi bacterium RBG_13_52_12]|nr:MAG: 50S ribosomal protein L15 [Chloroflexi bacterium RBG_13_52_12]